jgi:hypothetical protein
MRACEIDVSYGSLSVERLDIFHAHESDAPLLVFIQVATGVRSTNLTIPGSRHRCCSMASRSR